MTSATWIPPQNSCGLPPKSSNWTSSYDVIFSSSPDGDSSFWAWFSWFCPTLKTHYCFIYGVWALWPLWWILWQKRNNYFRNLWWRAESFILAAQEKIELGCIVLHYQWPLSFELRMIKSWLKMRWNTIHHITIRTLKIQTIILMIKLTRSERKYRHEDMIKVNKHICLNCLHCGFIDFPEVSSDSSQFLCPESLVARCREDGAKHAHHQECNKKSGNNWRGWTTAWSHAGRSKL